MNKVFLLLFYLLFFLVLPLQGFSQNEYAFPNTKYQVTANELLLTKHDSAFYEYYRYPQIIGMSDQKMEFEINKKLAEAFLPTTKHLLEKTSFPDQYVPDAYEYDSTDLTHWTHLEVGFKTLAAHPDFLSIEYYYTHAFEETPQNINWGSRFYNFDLKNNTLLDNMSLLFKSDSDSLLNQIFYTFISPDLYVIAKEQKDFSIFKTNDSGLWLQVYFPPFGLYFKVTDGKMEVANNGDAPTGFIIPLNALREVIAAEYLYLLDN